MQNILTILKNFAFTQDQIFFLTKIFFRMNLHLRGVDKSSLFTE